ncbi:MAG: hypothetical protein ACJ715_08125, partial [Ornithinibacter sp.]
MTGFADYYRHNVTWVGSLDRRLSTLADLVATERPALTLDLGCGEGVLLDALASLLPVESRLVG